jgi:hypothetical protein
MTKLSLCVAFTIALLVGVNSIPSLVYAQTNEEAAQPSEPPQNNATQPDETASPDESTGPEEQGEETQGEATDEPENQSDDQGSQDQE